jgi:phage tail protein X
MAQTTPGSMYTVQKGDTLPSIAQQVYGDESHWQDIYIANTQVIGNNPDNLSAGKALFLPDVSLNPLASLAPQLCTITSPGGLRIRTAPTTQSGIVATYPRGTVLNFVQVVNGEDLGGNPHWGRSRQGHYFWMGGTNRPNG